MKKRISKFAALCLALMVAFTCMPVLGMQEAYADDLNRGTIEISLSSGFAHIRDSGKLHAVRNTLAFLAQAGIIGSGTDADSGDDAYDLDNDGTMDIIAIYDPANPPYNSEMERYYICETTSFDDESWEIDVPESTKNLMSRLNLVYCERIEVDFPTLIRKLNIEIKAPACGTETTTPPDEYGWDMEKQTNPPEVEVTADGASFWMDDLMTYWISDRKGGEAYIGVMSSEESYLAGIDFIVEDGYYILKDADVKINGAELCEKNMESPFAFIVAAVKPTGDSHTAAAPEITKPTLSSDGSKVYKCKGCGRILKTEAISNKDLKEAYAAGKADADRAAKHTPGRAVIKKVKAGSKKAKISWKTVKKASAYELCFTNTKTGKVKTVTVKQTKKQAKKKTISKTVKKLKKGKYKVKVRAVNETGGEIFRGPWSKKKTVKIK